MKTKLIAFSIAFAALLLGSLIVLFIPNEAITKLNFTAPLADTGGLFVSVSKGQATVLVDGTDFGTTPQTISQLPVGQHHVELMKISENPSFYGKQTFVINVVKNAEVVINVELLPDDEFAGYIISFDEKLPDSPDQPTVSILCMPSDAEVFLDGISVGIAPLQNLPLSEGEHDIRLHAEGYEDLQFTLKAEPGYNLNIRTKLQPIPIEQQTNENSHDS